MSSCALSCWLLPAALLLPVSLPCCLHWADLWSEFLFQWLLFLKGLHFPCWDLSPKSLVCSGSMTSLLCSYFSLPCTFVDSCSLTALILFASFIFCLCTAEPRAQLCFTELGTVSWPWSPASAAGSGEKSEMVQSSSGLGQPWDGTSQGIGSAGISYSTLRAQFWPWTHNLEIIEDVNLYLWCVVYVWKSRLF